LHSLNRFEINDRHTGHENLKSIWKAQWFPKAEKKRRETKKKIIERHLLMNENNEKQKKYCKTIYILYCIEFFFFFMWWNDLSIKFLFFLLSLSISLYLSIWIGGKQTLVTTALYHYCINMKFVFCFEIPAITKNGG
jgi:hypothetical protein